VQSEGDASCFIRINQAMLNELEKAGVVSEDCPSPDFCGAKIVELIRPSGSPCGPAKAVQN